MELTMKGRNLELSEAIRDYVRQKLEHVGRHIGGARLANVQISQEKTRRVDQRFCAQITLDVHGSVVSSEERATTARGAVTAAVDVLDRRVGRLKGRLYRSERGKHSGASIRFEQPAEAEGLEEEREEEGKVVRVKRFPIKPMAVEEAIFQMDMLGHDFFLFLSTDGGQYNVLYKRSDGDYGLIIPEAL